MVEVPENGRQRTARSGKGTLETVAAAPDCSQLCTLEEKEKTFMREFGLHSLAPVARAHTLGLQGTLPGVANLQSTLEQESWKPRCSGLSSKPGMCVEIQPKSGLVVHACHFNTEKMRQGGL